MSSHEPGLGQSEACAACGRFPAVSIKLQSASSRIIWWNHTKIQKPLCAPCAEMMYLKMQERTLTQGWWGPLSALATVVFSIGNRIRISFHRKALPAIQVEEGYVRRFHLQVRKRPAAMILTAFALLVIASLAGGALTAPVSPNTDNPSSYIGSCWTETNGGNTLKIVSCNDSSAIYEVSKVSDVAQDCSDVYISVDTFYACMQRRI